MQGQDGDSYIVDQAVEKFLSNQENDFAPRGLVVKEALHDMLHYSGTRKDAHEHTLENMKVESVEFMLRQIYGMSLQKEDLGDSFAKNAKLHPLHPAQLSIQKGLFRHNERHAVLL